MTPTTRTKLPEVLQQHEDEILKQWVSEQRQNTHAHSNLINDATLQQQSREFLQVLGRSTQSGTVTALSQPEWKDTRQWLAELSRTRGQQGFSAGETAMFVFSLKQPLFAYLQRAWNGEAEALAADVWQCSVLLDQLGLLTMEAYQQGREQVIVRQQQELLELATPVVQLWQGILALPLIGTLDSARTQIVMESLLQEIVKTGADIAVIDITGVPTVDTLVAQHLLKTVAAARLMGADCIISGIRPQIAQTIVHLGVELSNVVTKATLADAFAVALQRRGMTIQRSAG